ncbi:hypothetical protein BLOT_009875 [Blomia tropicalis]|nr:hypothetical protein BLOT_009875 [Blomia tropicalis]
MGSSDKMANELHPPPPPPPPPPYTNDVLDEGIQSTFLSKMSLKRNANLAFWLVLPRSFFSPTVSPLTSCEGTSSMSLSAQASQSINTYINTNNNNN